MKGKEIFTREAAKANLYIKERPSYLNQKYILCDISVITHQFSHIHLKEGWKVFSSEGQVFAQTKANVTVEDPMAALRGDESPLSYMQAAVCYHQFFLYSMEQTNVNTSAIVDDERIRLLDLFGYWSFGKVKRSLNPIFFYDSLLHPVIIFFTYHRDGVDVVEKHIHRFDHVGYALKFQQRLWASSEKGTRESTFFD
ncbi:hypothetical protein [Halobacillus sp. BBL2006]|uniref:hypothetical protein n=1 Tax=Halobacillus sp. BBL2006 TaxID=1543706 RepID=UPI000542A07F|nr:hypothetical protein [Halobacillus sp. BBL2006]KHE73113.1 hypothetical protein LD39_01020 [Halobacillus sp. BBL2006]